MIPRSFGPYYPVAGNDDPEGRSRNRRVEISVVPRSAAFTAGSLVGSPDFASK
jgi:hypothetical protein